MAKPPIGLKPKWASDRERLDEVRSAMHRYSEADLKIPIKWVKEYNELIDSLFVKKPTTELSNLEPAIFQQLRSPNLSHTACTYFMVGVDTSSLTKCSSCGKEKWEHFSVTNSHF